MIRLKTSWRNFRQAGILAQLGLHLQQWESFADPGDQREIKRAKVPNGDDTQLNARDVLNNAALTAPDFVG